MHGRIFVVDTWKDIKQRGEVLTSPWEPWEMKEVIPCDYIVEQGPECFKQDCLWLEEVYNLQGHTRFLTFEEHTLFEIQIDPLIRSLEQIKKKKIEEIKAELNKPFPDIDMWRIKDTAWNSPFWFIFEEFSLEPEMGFLEYLLHLKQIKQISTILITESYDYHV